MIKVYKITQKKINVYELLFDNGIKLNVYDEVIIKFNLVVGTVIHENFIKEINKYNDLMIIFFKYRNSLLKRKKSEFNILNSLKKENIKEEDEQEIINKLKRLNLINDDLYLRSYINDQIKLTLKGPLKIKRNLLQEKISAEKIDFELDKYNEEFWINRINKIIEKRKKMNHKDSNQIFKIKTKRYLISEGYNGEFNLEKDDALEFELLKKEYNKLYSKYERKKIDFKCIKYDLIKKGYTLEDIKKLEN